MLNLGVGFLEHSFKILVNQTFKDFDIIISDHSNNDEIKKLCEKYSEKLDIKYIKNTENRGNSSQNINNAIKNSESKLIKIIFQDDFLYDKDSLKHTVDNFDLSKDKWLVSRCEHSYDGVTFHRDFSPVYNHNIHFGNNTISSPSVLTILNDNPLLFDENLIFLMDCEYYKRCYDNFGLPKILNIITAVNRVGKHQVSNYIVNTEISNKETNYVKNKFNGTTT
jgi:cellulose synthase/poly-beta-1,6-N-acetylglucosamine synthase-like glycosyltransferase